MKFLLQLAAALVFVLLMREIGFVTSDLYIPFFNVTVYMPEWLYFIFAAFVIVGTVNAVNITDGIDGLAAGTSIPVFLFYVVVAILWGENYLELGIFASGMVGGLMGFAGNAEYSGSKAAAHGRAKAIAREMGPYNVTYNVVAPGCTATDMVAAAKPEDVEKTRLATPLQRLIDPQEIADAVLYLLSADSVTGQILSPNAGLYI